MDQRSGEGQVNELPIDTTSRYDYEVHMWIARSDLWDIVVQGRTPEEAKEAMRYAVNMTIKHSMKDST